MRLLILIVVLASLPIACLSAQQGWRLETASAPWVPFEFHASIAFDDKLWLLYAGGGDVWATTDGASWNLEGSASGVAIGPHLTRFNGEWWVFGGQGYSSSVWRSPDLVSWTQEADAPWSGRNNAACVAYDGKLWILGGLTRQSPYIFALNDVWSTSDGVNWTQEVAAASWPARDWHTAAVFNNRMWVLGGRDGQGLDDVWSSTDGINWVHETANAPWGPRTGHATVVYRDRLWVIGGGYGSGYPEFYDDAWSTADGKNWVKETDGAPWGIRAGQAVTVYNNRIWLSSGVTGSGYLNDVWSYGLHVSTDALPDGIVDRPYFGRLEAREGDEFFTWTLTGGGLPPGLTLDTQSTTAFVTITGTPESTGDYTFTVEVEDTDGNTTEQEISLTINPPPPIGNDGNGGSSGTGCTAGPAGLPWLILYGALTLTAAAILRRRVVGG